MNNTIFPGLTFDRVVDNFFNKSLSDIIGTDYSYTQAALNMVDAEDKLIIELAAPGLEKSDFNIDINNQILNISVDKSNNNESPADEKLSRQEFNYNTIKRKVKLSNTLDLEKISASYELGILKIELAKKVKSELEPKTITVS